MANEVTETVLAVVTAAIAKAERTEMTVSLPHSVPVMTALMSACDKWDAWHSGIDGREYRAFFGPNECWRVVIVGGLYNAPGKRNDALAAKFEADAEWELRTRDYHDPSNDESY